MAAGSVQQIVVCVANGTTGNSTAPCATVGSVRYKPAVVSAYVLDASVTLESTVQAVPFDYVQAAAAFGFGLTMVLTFWFTAKPIGMLLGLVKRS